VSPVFADGLIRGNVTQLDSNTFQVDDSNSNFACSTVGGIDLNNYNNLFDIDTQYAGFPATNSESCTQISSSSFQIHYDFLKGLSRLESILLTIILEIIILTPIRLPLQSRDN